MKETLIVLAVILILLGLTAFRYRRQIMAGVKIWRMMKGIREQVKGSVNDAAPSQMQAGKLLNCSKCGTWVSEDRAITLGRNTYFCSTACLENVKVG
jgi:hypothetical protein